MVTILLLTFGMPKPMKKQNKMKRSCKITIIQDKALLGANLHSEIADDETYSRDCMLSHIVAIKQKRGYVIIKHLWHKVPMKFKNKYDLTMHLSNYM